VGGRFTGAAGRQLVAEPHDGRLQQCGGERDWLVKQRREAAGEFGGQILAGKRQSRQMAGIETVSEIDDQRQQPPLQVHRCAEVGSGLNQAPPAAFRRGEDLGLRETGDRVVGHGTL
jgi:hypothetical protein